jgi:predicted ester cyclase
MSEKYEATVRRLMDETWNKGNLNVLDELLTPDHVTHDPMAPSRGIKEVKDSIGKYRAAFPDVRCEIDELLLVGDKVVTRFHYSGTHKNQFEGIAPTGRRVNGTGITIQRFKGDRIQETFTNWDALGLMQQLGVVTLPGKTSAAGR